MKTPARRRMLVVDGYNVLGARAEMTKNVSLDDARDELVRRMHNYAGYTGQEVVLVFDAWLSDRRARTEEVFPDGFRVVFTQKGETADHYIERLCDSCQPLVDRGALEIRVATSDNVEQTVVFGRGATRMSSRELLYEMREVAGAKPAPERKICKSSVMDHLPEEIRARLEEMRRR